MEAPPFQDGFRKIPERRTDDARSRGNFAATRGSWRAPATQRVVSPRAPVGHGRRDPASGTSPDSLEAATYAAYGGLDLAGVIAAAAAGAIVGDTIGYSIGRRGGRALLERHARRFGLYHRRLARAQEFFDRHGGKTVFLGRFVAFLRMFAALLAGVAC